MKRWMLLLVLFLGLLQFGCTSPAKRIRRIKLGMSPDEIREQMGDPYTIRAAKIYEDGNWTQIWEYQAAPFELNPKTFWIYFENGRCVQWGEPGDFAGKAGGAVPVSEYSEQKVLR